MTKEEFKIIFSTKLIDAFPHSEAGKHTARLFWDHFKEIPSDKFAMAAHMAVEESKYFPSVSEIREYISNVSGIISFDETYVLIQEIKDKAYNGSWRRSDYSEIVVKIIDDCGLISRLSRLTSEEELYIVKKKYRDIVQDLKRQDDGIKQLR